jgi:hypothetical protein
MMNTTNTAPAAIQPAHCCHCQTERPFRWTTRIGWACTKCGHQCGSKPGER